VSLGLKVKRGEGTGLKGGVVGAGGGEWDQRLRGERRRVGLGVVSRCGRGGGVGDIGRGTEVRGDMGGGRVGMVVSRGWGGWRGEGGGGRERCVRSVGGGGGLGVEGVGGGREGVVLKAGSSPRGKGEGGSGRGAGRGRGGGGWGVMMSIYRGGHVWRVGGGGTRALVRGSAMGVAGGEAS